MKILEIGFRESSSIHSPIYFLTRDRDKNTSNYISKQTHFEETLEDIMTSYKSFDDKEGLVVVLDGVTTDEQKKILSKAMKDYALSTKESVSYERGILSEIFAR